MKEIVTQAMEQLNECSMKKYTFEELECVLNFMQSPASERSSFVELQELSALGRFRIYKAIDMFKSLKVQYEPVPSGFLSKSQRQKYGRHELSKPKSERKGKDEFDFSHVKKTWPI